MLVGAVEQAASGLRLVSHGYGLVPAGLRRPG